MTSRNPFHQCFKSTALVFIALSLAACGASKPGADDIAPFVLQQIGDCPLWDVTEFRKVDGIDQGNEYRVDFAAKLTFKEDKFKTYLGEDITHRTMAPYDKCLALGLILMQNGLSPDNPNQIPKQFDVIGSGVLAKSEKGWRLSGHLDYKFVPHS
jgi:hypothetical protein